MMRTIQLAALGAILLVAWSGPSAADPCQIQNTRKVGNTLVCVYNCNGKIVTLTSSGGACPIILE